MGAGIVQGCVYIDTPMIIVVHKTCACAICMLDTQRDDRTEELANFWSSYGTFYADESRLVDHLHASEPVASHLCSD